MARYVSTRHRKIDISDAANEAFISLKAGHGVRVIQNQPFAHCNITPHIILESDSFETAKHIAARAKAVMITPYVYIENMPILRSLVNAGTCAFFAAPRASF